MTEAGVGTFGSLLSAEMVWVAEQINARYPDLVLGWIPPENRGRDDNKPFAVMYDQTREIIVRLTPDQVNPHILRWLHEHDGSKTDIWKNLVNDIQKEKEQREKANREKLMEKAEIVHSIAKSNKHTYRVGGQKIGADNHAPRIPKVD